MLFFFFFCFTCSNIKFYAPVYILSILVHTFMSLMPPFLDNVKGAVSIFFCCCRGIEGGYSSEES